MNDVSDVDRRALWLPLVRRLTEACGSWYIWKNMDSALTGPGDIDSAAPAPAWPAIEGEFRDWAADQGLEHVVVCRHIPRTLNLFAVAEGIPHLLQLEVKGLTTLRGSTLFRAEDLLPLTLIDEHGARRLRPGAEGLFTFVFSGVRRGGEPDREALRARRVMELIEEDPSGVREAARVFGSAEQSVLAAVESARRGGWDRRALRRVERRAALRTLLEPHVLLERVWFRVARKPSCPVLRLVYRDRRRAPDDLAGWLAEVGRSHPVHPVCPGGTYA